MKAPAFWWEDGSIASALLAPIGQVWGWISAARMARDGARAAVPVVCIGNLVAGGAGKGHKSPHGHPGCRHKSPHDKSHKSHKEHYLLKSYELMSLCLIKL